MMLRALAALSLYAAVQGSIARYELYPYDSVADPKAVVVLGNARFTVLADGIIRMEYSDNGVWEDRPTLAVVNRKTEVPVFNQSVAGDTVVLTTKRARLTYTKGEGGFTTAKVLKVEPVGDSTFKTWTYGQTSATDAGNLRGTVRTLDEHVNGTVNCNRYLPDGHCTWGLVSRTGWALIEETGAPCLDADDWWTDSSGKLLRNTDTTDIYILAYSHDYMTALGDFTKIGGKIPIFPRSSHGVWFTRWFDFANVDIRKVVEEYEEHGMPMDVLTLDMNWHTKNDWTGYTFDGNLFPYPEDTMGYFHQKGLLVDANIHDAHGIGKWEDKYLDACAALGIDPNHPGGDLGIPFSAVNKTYIEVLEDIVMLPVEKAGMDFWWLDWQQSSFDGGAGQDPEHLRMNPTIWTAKIRVTDSKRRCVQNGYCTNKRGVAASRWGGLGQHRYQHGFSGDVLTLEWFNLAFQTYFTATAVNVGWGYWSHDIVGPGRNHEMYSRWIQLGCLSGIMRSHDRGLSAGEFCETWPYETTSCDTVKPYNVPLVWRDINRAALRMRTSMIPYTYTHTAKAHQTGVGLIRPMYYHFPEEADAYPISMDKDLGQDPSTRQYMFGESILAAPVTGPSGCASPFGVADEPCGLRSQQVWIPPGTWIEKDSGKAYTGPAMIEKKIANWEIPMYIKAGAIIPTIPLRTGNTLGRAADPYRVLEFTVYPGAATGNTAVYEDDGITFDYLNGKSAWINAMYTRNEQKMMFSVNTTGTFQGQPTSRTVILKIVNALPPAAVRVNGKAYGFNRWGGPGGWSFDAAAMEVVIEAVESSVGSVVTIEIDFTTGTGVDLTGYRGLVSRAVYAKRNLDETRVTPGSREVDPNGAPLLRLAAIGDALAYTAGTDLPTFISLAKSVPSLHSAATQEIAGLPGLIAAVCTFSLDTTPMTPDRSPTYPTGLKCDREKCCQTCTEDPHCNAWMHLAIENHCYPLRKAGPPLHGTPGIVFGTPKGFTREAYSLDLMQSA
eukprot:TRINITY_DN11809_c0_g1_i1.p1 TRINITY_DN11809_c0_g1~~TRINITY_DN11809_c0_g1_i1.p1  ORF type:complete len:1002 (+),score=182.69 TRINITY_DN11809_c0_g1_i1:42-3047(+)